MRIRQFISITIFIFCTFSLSYAYDSEYVHPQINITAANQSILEKENILLNIGLANGLDTELTVGNETLTVERWIGRGGIDEDQLLRPLNHFHDPSKPWESAGFLTYGGMSSLLWAQYPVQEYSWLDSRLAYLEALETGEKAKFAQTFYTLGHIMHLVSDKAVPAHVRNDAHPPLVDPDSYESWTKSFEERFNKMIMFSSIDESTNKLKTELYSEHEISLSIFDNAIPYPSASSPISALWDMNIYEGENPDPAVTWGSDIGLAEFTNANFFSDDTIFSNYQHPGLDDTNYADVATTPEIIDTEDGVKDHKIYLWRTINGAKRYRLAAMGYFAWDTIYGTPYSFLYVLDDTVHKDYAAQLLPRAVGYSSALLDYFFRGDIDMVPDPNSYGYIITNDSNEEMSGTFALYYDDINGDRHLVEGAEWELTIGPKVGDTPGESMSVFFTPPTFPTPEQVGQYMLVFHGRMGNEEGAVAGKVIEPPVPYILITMTTKTHSDLGIPSEQLPDIVVVWDMTTNNFARIMNTNGELISFPMEYDDFIASYSDTGTMQYLNYKLLFADYSMFTDTIPYCYVPNTTIGSSAYGCPAECLCLSSCSYPDLTGTETDSCVDNSNLPGGLNTKSATATGITSLTCEHPMEPQKYCNYYDYEITTLTSTSTYEEHVEVQVAGEDVALWNYIRKSPVLFLLKPHRIDVLNNSNADSKYINMELSWTVNTQKSFNGTSEYIYSILDCSHDWSDSDLSSYININLYNSFFDWMLDVNWSTTLEYTGPAKTIIWPEDNCGDGLWNPPENYLEKISYQSAVKNYITGDFAISGIQSNEDEYYQYQVGLFYFSNRRLTNTFNSIYSNDGVNETHELADVTTDGPTQTEVRAFCSLFPPGETTAENVNPWTLPMNEALQNAINQMVGYFAQNYGVDPMAVNPGYFDDDMYHEQNIWDRDFNVRSIYINAK